MKPIYIENQILSNYKSKIFQELIRIIWYENLNDINEIPQKVLKDLRNDINKEIDEGTVINLIRIIMGLDPIDRIDDVNLKDLINEATNLKQIQMPVISIIDDACKYCESSKGECLTKSKHIHCNKESTCSSCGQCMYKCKLGAISDKIEFIPMINMLKSKEYPVYAAVAPAFIGQFGENVTAGILRSALKSIGFEDMIEVAFAADILTAKEAYSFYENMNNNNKEFFITSCCCPVWVNLVKNKFPIVADKISTSVSPMIACGRIIKILNPSAKVVFIGPCIAKKEEAKEDALNDAIDFVLTFEEIEQIFKALNVNLLDIEEDAREESSYCGRIYAKSGGVSKSIEATLKEIDSSIKFKPIAFQGAKECIEDLNKVINKELDVNFIEGMGCIGGCIGGPKKLLSVDKGSANVDKYSNEADMKTPLDNLNVAQFLIQIGILKVENLNVKDHEKIQKIFERSTK
ncbi:[Fe-Fe] hydrogenase large subunit C-terminal domain-containing protein [Romboutsia sp. Marseille-P6047]|uniref:[Fe-Fe] hydrogenase large subunit C-terminal domain-containing protein n=1 Tax=Romboutsia sp. Marseille-P6047 TaxID=2161817 RepID=UPI000F062747|nr:[Fe-Fe] hydrogenase large subunit C-terminal domain-containing protein [Romboutsia sp. Marseille-P6047]